MLSKVSTLYADPAQPGSLGGIAKFAKAHKIPLSQAKEQLQQLLSYTLHKPRRRRFPTLPTLVFSINGRLPYTRKRHQGAASFQEPARILSEKSCLAYKSKSTYCLTCSIFLSKS